MTDIALTWGNGVADIALNGADVLADEGLRTAVNLTLACDARCEEDELPEGETDRRGWWGDQFAATPTNTGTKLWLLARAPRNDATLQRARQHVLDGLRLFIDDGIASQVDCVCTFDTVANITHSASRSSDIALVIDLTVSKPDGGQESFRYWYHWQKEFERVD